METAITGMDVSPLAIWKRCCSPTIYLASIKQLVNDRHTWLCKRLRKQLEGDASKNEMPRWML